MYMQPKSWQRHILIGKISKGTKWQELVLNTNKTFKKLKTYNFLIPEVSDFFHGASSGSYGIGPCTGRSLESVSESESLQKW